MSKCVIATSRSWNESMVKRLNERSGSTFYLVNDPSRLTIDVLSKIAPSYIFFPHWSYIIPENIHENFECVIFHMTDLPYGRGGSPLQNLISRKVYSTKVSALKCVKELDAGDIYLKKDLSLHGNAEEIYLRASEVIEEMILEIIKNQIMPYPQQGEPVAFRRRIKDEGDIENLESLVDVFDWIRMLDADGYPKAFLENKNFRFEFSRASLKDGSVKADVTIHKKTK